MPTKTAKLSSINAPSATKKVRATAALAPAAVDTSAYYKDMGALIGYHRRRAKLTQADLAGMIGLTRSSVTNIEGGIQAPQPLALSNIAQALKVDIGQLFPKAGSTQEEFKATLEKLDPAARDVIERFVGKV